MSDLLDMDALNALPHPLIAKMCGGSVWEVHDIDVETGLMRLNVCGKLDVVRFAEVMEIQDVDGASHDPDSFYLEETKRDE